VQTPTRRELLGGLGAASAALVAGCAGGPATDDNETDRSGTGESGSGDPGAGGGSTGPVAGQQFAGECPRYVSTDRVICWDAVGAKDVPGVLEPSGRTLSPGGAIEFTLHNRSDAGLETNLYNWHLHKRVDDRWFQVAPLSWPQPLTTLDPDGSHTWTVSLTADVDPGQPVPRLRTPREIPLVAVGGGDYAFRARGRFTDDEFQTAIGFAATFGVDAPQLELTPTNVVGEPEIDGDTLRVDSTRPGPSAETQPRLYTLERLDPPVVEAERMIAEEIVRRVPLRDIVALAERHEVDRVELTEVNGALPSLVGSVPRPIEYRGSYYEVSSAAQG